MQGSIGKQRLGSRVIGGVLAMVGAVTAVSLYSFYRVDRVSENVELANQFYVPVLKHLNVLNGKWVAYQRTFESSVSFRKWGASTTERDRSESRIHLSRMVEANLAELERRTDARRTPDAAQLKTLIERLRALAATEPATLAGIESYLKTKHYAEAAALYSRARQQHLEVSQDMAQLSRDVENHLTLSQLSTERELRNAQSVMLALMAASLVFSLFVFFRIRRWIQPIIEWTRVAQEIALKGGHRDVRFPAVRSGMPAEIALLTREFTRMGTTILERERTIGQQKQKLETLNAHLKEQNLLLGKLGGLNERILNSMSSGLLVINGAGIVEQFNERYCELFAVERTAVRGRPARAILAGWPPALVDGWLSASEPLHLARAPLGSRVFDVRVQQLTNEEGRLVLLEDVSELVAAEEKLEHARKLVLAGNLSAQVAHEVRNPLNSMSLQLEMLEEDVAGTDARARVAAIAEQVERLERITRRYLDVGRAPSRHRERVDLHALIEECVAFLSSELQAARVELSLELAPGGAIVDGDADAISQVLFNLMRNAVEAMHDTRGPRRLAITTHVERGVARCRVSDTGPGVDGAIRGRVFEPFVTTKASGHGLGLSVSRQICIEHGGELTLAQAPDGAGICGGAFEFALPAGGGACSAS